MARGIASGKRLSKGSWSRMADRVGMLRFSYQYQKHFRSELLINYFHEKELCSMIAVNKKVRERVTSDVTYINLYPHFLDEHGTAIDARFSNDALHLNGEGYRVWKEIIEGLVVENG